MARVLVRICDTLAALMAPTDAKRTCGWDSRFPRFRDTPAREIRRKLQDFCRDSDITAEQISAWDDSIPSLQQEVAEVLLRDRLARDYSAILEYELPLECRRPDAVFLVGGDVVVVELKGKTRPTLADIDQVAAYARDLSCYHAECDGRRVAPVLVPTHASGDLGTKLGVRIVGPDHLDAVVGELSTNGDTPIDRDQFLSEDAYRPLPTIVEAARELFQTRELRYIKRARAATDPTIQRLTEIAMEAARTHTRRLVLVTGIPGAGKTLVGLQLAHARVLDELAVARAGKQPTTPAVFLSGNRPLVAVLQYQLKDAGGDGKTFVRHVIDYVRAHRSGRTPSEHVLIFDEAQRAYDADRIDELHKTSFRKSEAELFIEFADRIPAWCVVVALIGSGQEIHAGEEGGLAQWRAAVEASPQKDEWTIHSPSGIAALFAGEQTLHVESEDKLSLDRELRQHRAVDLHRFVDGLLHGLRPSELRPLADRLAADTFQLRLTRDLESSKAYLRDRFSGDPLARFGMLASSRDQALESFDVPNGYKATSRIRVGPWYSDDEGAPRSQSCRTMRTCVTEFGAQGLELDGVLLAWGTDLLLLNGVWSIDAARRYRSKSVKNPRQLRLNAYRVLLTRARDVCVVFVPPISELDETFNYLADCGFVSLQNSGL